jgi:hypothetical protein
LRNRAAVLILFTSGLFAQSVRVPFVGCPSDGQAERRPAPRGVDKFVETESRLAKSLAYYRSEGNAALGPLGWSCIGLYGSSGTDLYITPDPLDVNQVFSGDHGITGPVVQVETITTENGSGRHDAAQILARVFPKQRAFVQSVRDLFDLPPTEFNFSPYPADRLILQTENLVQFQTPPHAEGLGSMWRIKASGDPIDGVAIWHGPAPHRLATLAILRVRLPREQRGLAPGIIKDLLLRQSNNSR